MGLFRARVARLRRHITSLASRKRRTTERSPHTIETVLRDQIARARADAQRRLPVTEIVNPERAGQIAALESLLSTAETLEKRRWQRISRWAVGIVAVVVLMMAGYLLGPTTDVLVDIEASASEIELHLTQNAALDVVSPPTSVLASGFTQIKCWTQSESVARDFAKARAVQPSLDLTLADSHASAIDFNPIPLPAGRNLSLAAGPGKNVAWLNIQHTGNKDDMSAGGTVTLSLRGPVLVNGVSIAFDREALTLEAGPHASLGLGFADDAETLLRVPPLAGAQALSFNMRYTNLLGARPELRCPEPFACPSSLLKGTLSFAEIGGTPRVLRAGEHLKLATKEAFLHRLEVSGDGVALQLQARAMDVRAGTTVNGLDIRPRRLDDWRVNRPVGLYISIALPMLVAAVGLIRLFER